MPIYEFRCASCLAEFELLVGMGHKDVSCPECGSGECEKQFSTFGFSSGGKFTSSHGSACSGCSKGSCKNCN
ncbi:MAG: zinc ribbon domain-containing protein [Candidatus Zixiibacteriota bacterium]